MPTDTELINQIWSGLFVGGEYTTRPESAILTADGLINTVRDKVDNLRAYLESNAGLGDIRHDGGAVYTAVVVGEMVRKLDEIRQSAYLGDPGTPIGTIQTQTADIPTIVGHTAQIALDTIEIIGGIATAETGIGVAVAALGVLNLATDAIKLQNDLIGTKVDGIPLIQEDVGDLSNQINDLSDLVTGFATNIALIKRLHQILTGTDWDGYTLRLDDRTRLPAEFITRDLLRFSDLASYLAVGLLTAPPAGYWEAGIGVPVEGTTVVDLEYAYGLKIEFDPLPAWVALTNDPPYRYQPLGYLAFGRLGGFHGSEPITYDPTVVQPLPAGVEQVRVELRPGLSGTAYPLRVKAGGA